MFEKLLSLLGLLDKADIVYENVREDSKKEDTTKNDYHFSDADGFPATKKEANKPVKKNVKKATQKIVEKKINEKEER